MGFGKGEDEGIGVVKWVGRDKIDEELVVVCGLCRWGGGLDLVGLLGFLGRFGYWFVVEFSI